MHDASGAEAIEPVEPFCRASVWETHSTRGGCEKAAIGGLPLHVPIQELA